jgi:MFS family permease
LSWRWVFYINVPIGLLAATTGFLFLEDPLTWKVPQGIVGGLVCHDPVENRTLPVRQVGYIARDKPDERSIC